MSKPKLRWHIAIGTMIVLAGLWLSLILTGVVFVVIWLGRQIGVWA